MPIEELRVAIDKLVFPLTFTNTDLLKDVQWARHALSIDEERSSFAPLLWDHEEDDGRLKQVWFAGVHANVGGGYPDDSLSWVPLAWMVFEAKHKGLQFHQHALDGIRKRATPFGKMYDFSRRLRLLLPLSTPPSSLPDCRRYAASAADGA